MAIAAFIILQVFCNTCSFEYCRISLGCSQFLLRKIQSSDAFRLDQPRASDNIGWIIGHIILSFKQSYMLPWNVCKSYPRTMTRSVYQLKLMENFKFDSTEVYENMMTINLEMRITGKIDDKH